MLQKSALQFKKNFDKETLNQGIDICRQCHSGIHNRYDEMTLAKTRNTVAQLQNDAELQKHFRWVAKQKVRKKSAWSGTTVASIKSK